ncbi:uncharacterized protein LOC117168449 [Belonocnema kinseyi]|uniref:uncharacterized protein LOC117168449 n=1 Tax=Belonocnema kinseyi TaxID=2817044 RepID=UPI00143CF954|nr:uncharacterized protein LOC117168449 [Belonocnema kinseyi]
MHESFASEKEKKADKYLFKKLQSDAEKRLRDSWSTFLCSRSKVIIGQWDELGVSPKKLFIDTDIIAKVYLHDVQIMLPGIKDVRSFEDVSYNLALLERIKPCPGIDRRTRSEACCGYIEENSRSEFCIPCRLQRRKIISREAYQKKRSEKESRNKKPNPVTKFREGMKHMKKMRSNE